MAVKLREGQLLPFSSRTLHLSALVQNGVALEDVMASAFWTDVSTRLKRGARIEVLSEDGSLDADLRVTGLKEVANGPPIVTVKLIRLGFVDPGVEVVEDPMVAKWAGPKDLWRIMRGDVVIEKQFESRETAEARIKELAA